MINYQLKINNFIKIFIFLKFKIAHIGTLEFTKIHIYITALSIVLQRVVGELIF